MIIDGSAKTRTVIMPARKAYMTAPFDPAARKPAEAEKSDVQWTRTGKTETVAAVKCEVIHGVGTENGKPKEADLCVARGFGFGGGSTGGGPFSEALTEYANLRLAPGEGIVKMTSIEGGKPQVAAGADESRPPPAGRHRFPAPRRVHQDGAARAARPSHNVLLGRSRRKYLLLRTEAVSGAVAKW